MGTVFCNICRGNVSRLGHARNVNSQWKARCTGYMEMGPVSTCIDGTAPAKAQACRSDRRCALDSNLGDGVVLMIVACRRDGVAMASRKVIREGRRRIGKYTLMGRT